MYPVYQNAHKLLGRFPNRSFSVRTSMYNVTQSLHSQDQVHFFCGNEDNDVVSWTSMISNSVKENQPQKAIGLFKKMLISSQKPNYVTVLSSIRASSSMDAENLTFGIHCFAIKMGFELEIPIVTALLGFYSVWDMEAAWKLFLQAPEKDVILWSAMISAFVKIGEYIMAIDLFKEMQLCGIVLNYVSILSILPACANLGALRIGRELHGFSIKRSFNSYVNIQNSLVDMYTKCGSLKSSICVFQHIERKDLVSWKNIINGCINNDCPRKALNFFYEMQFCCFEMDASLIRKVIGAVSKLDATTGQGIHCFVLKSGFFKCVSVVTALLQMYASFGNIGSSRSLFDSLSQKDIIAWSAMISAYAQSEQPYNALAIFRQMQSEDVKPNEFAYVSLLQACSSMAAQDVGEAIHTHVMKLGYTSNAFLASALIDMYCKFGRIHQGKDIFDENPPNKDLICWSSMINGYGINSHGYEALECFLDMLSRGIQPNDVVFVSVLSTCSHCGLEYEGWNWFHAMEEKYNITPKLAHYACMVDMLSRQGNVEEALEFINKMPIEADKRIWGALLAGCRKTRGSSELFEVAAKHLISSDPKNASYHVLLSNLYADQGRWEEVQKLRQLMDEKERRKKGMGSSVIQVNA